MSYNSAGSEDIFPGGEHNRWVHTVGVFNNVTQMYSGLLADPEVPSALILLDPADIETALVAAILHDAGQTTFGHDFETIEPHLKHELLIKKLLNDGRWDHPTLGELISEQWPRVKLGRILQILGIPDEDSDPPEILDPVDGLAADCISGPIDADKQDYLMRDSLGCGVPYGNGLDLTRLWRSVTISPRSPSLLGLAYKAKGRSAVESFLFARYHMYTAVYWHHTFRSIQAMFTHGAASTLSKLSLSPEDLQFVFYERLLCGTPWAEVIEGRPQLKELYKGGRSREIRARKDRALDLLWILAGNNLGARELIERLARRELYKRIYEVSLGDIHGQAAQSYNDIKNAMSGPARLTKAAQIEVDIIKRLGQAAQPLEKFRNTGVPLIVLDMPNRGVPTEKNVPYEIKDAFRKYFPLAGGRPTTVVDTIQELQQKMASFRVFAAPELQTIIVRHLRPEDISASIIRAMPHAQPA